jgi:hypothetical protein
LKKRSGQHGGITVIRFSDQKDLLILIAQVVTLLLYAFFSFVMRFHPEPFREEDFGYGVLRVTDLVIPAA